MKTLLLSLALLAVAVILMGVNVLFRKGRSFPSGHAHDLADIPRRQETLRREIDLKRRHSGEPSITEKNKTT